MVIGRGVRRTVGRGSDTNRGAGRRITTAAGFSTTAAGSGCRAVISTRREAGGGPRSSRSSVSIFHLAITSAGIRFRTTSAIHIRDSIDATIPTMVAVAVMVVMDVMVVDAMVADATVTDVTLAGGAGVMDPKVAKVKVGSPEGDLAVAMLIGAV